MLTRKAVQYCLIFFPHLFQYGGIYNFPESAFEKALEVEGGEEDEDVIEEEGEEEDEVEHELEEEREDGEAPRTQTKASKASAGSDDSDEDGDGDESDDEDEIDLTDDEEEEGVGERVFVAGSDFEESDASDMEVIQTTAPWRCSRSI